MYSIKTDLAVTGNTNVGKELSVKGNAVFDKNVTIKGTVSFADATFTAITVDQATINTTLDVTGKASLKGGMDVLGNTVIGNTTAGSDTATINSNATFNGTSTFAKDITQTSGKAIFQDTTTSALEVNGTTTLNGNLTAAAATTASFDKLTANEATIATVSATDITATGATVENLTVTGKLDGDFTLGDVNTDNLVVEKLSTLKGAVTLESNIIGTNTVANLKAVSLGSNAADSTARLGFAYTAPGLRPTVILQNEVQSELMTPANLTVLKTATFGDVSAATNGITAKGLNLFDYLTLSGNSIQDPTTPILRVTKGKTQLTDLQVDGTTNITGKTTVGDLDITGTLSGNFVLSDITADNLVVEKLTTLKGALNLESNIVGSTANANLKSVTLGGNVADTNAKVNFTYTAPGLRPTVILQNEVQSELMTPANLTVLKTATFGDVSASTYGITAKGLNLFDYLKITGNAVQDPNTLTLDVDGKAQFKDVNFTGTVTGFVPDISGQDITPKDVTASGNISGVNLDASGTLTVDGDSVLKGTTITDLTVTGTTTGITLAGQDITPKDVTASGNVKGVDVTASGNLTVDGTTTLVGNTVVDGLFEVVGQTTTVKDLNVTGTLSGAAIKANVDGLDILPNSVTTTEEVAVGTNLSVGGNALFSGLKVEVTGKVTGVGSDALETGSIESDGTITAPNITATTKVTAASAQITGTGTGLSVDHNASVGGDLNVTGTLTAGVIDLSAADVTVKTLDVSESAHVGGNLTVDGTVDLSAADVSVKSLTSAGPVISNDATGTNILPKLQSTDITTTNSTTGTATVTTANISTLNVTGESTLAAVSAVSVTTPSIVNTDGINLENDTVAHGDLTVKGTFTPEGGLDLSPVDISSKSLTTTEGATIGGSLTVDGAINAAAADLTVKSLTSSGVITVTENTEPSILPKLTSTEATAGKLNVTGDATVGGKATVSGALEVTGASTFGNAVTVNVGGITAKGGLTVASGNLKVAAAAVVDGSVSAGSYTSAGDKITLAKPTDVTGDLHVEGAFTATSVDFSTTDLTVKSLQVDNDVTIDGNLTITNADLETNSLASTTSTTVGTDLILTTGTITGAPTISGATTLSSTLHTVGAATFDGTVDVGGKITSKSIQVSATGVGVAVDNDATVGGYLTIGETLGVTGLSTLSGGVDAGSALIKTTGEVQSATLQTSGKATLASVDVSGDAVVTGDLTVKGAFTPEGSLNLGSAVLNVEGVDASANLTALGSVTAGTTLTVTGVSTLNGGTNTTTLSTSGKATLSSAEVTGALSAGGALAVTGTTNLTGKLTAGEAALSSLTVSGDVTINGTLNPGTLDLSTTPVDAKSLKSRETLEVTGLSTLTGGLAVSANTAITAAGDITGTTITTTGKGTFGSAAVTTGLTVGGALVVNGASVNISDASTVTMPKADISAKGIIIGPKVSSRPETIQFVGDTYIGSNLFVAGNINGSVDLAGQDISLNSLTSNTTIHAVEDITTDEDMHARAATFGAQGSTANSLTVNGNAVTTGDFTVSGKIIGTLDQSASAVEVKSLTSTTFIAAGTTLTVGSTITAEGLSTLKGGIATNGATINAGDGAITTTGDVSGANVSASGAVTTATITTSGLATMASAKINTTLAVTGATTLSDVVTIGKKLTVSTGGIEITAGGFNVVAGGAAITGATNLKGAVTLGSASADAITVTGTSSFAENATFAKDVTIEGTLHTDIADLVTESVTTKKYAVTPAAKVQASVAAPSEGTWSPDGESNVYYITLDQASTTLGPINGLIGSGKAGSYYIYVQQDATGGRELITDGTYAVVGGEINKTQNTVSIIQLIYDGYSPVVDMFIAQRTA
ncbi:TPA: hypothetical protein OGU99_000392 [Escherichia coli]|nr:hypothetical protein [Escherichia coli]